MKFACYFQGKSIFIPISGRMDRSAVKTLNLGFDSQLGQTQKWKNFFAQLPAGRSAMKGLCEATTVSDGHVAARVKTIERFLRCLHVN